MEEQLALNPSNSALFAQQTSVFEIIQSLQDESTLFNETLLPLHAQVIRNLMSDNAHINSQEHTAHNQRLLNEVYLVSAHLTPS